MADSISEIIPSSDSYSDDRISVDSLIIPPPVCIQAPLPPPVPCHIPPPPPISYRVPSPPLAPFHVPPPPARCPASPIPTRIDWMGFGSPPLRPVSPPSDSCPSWRPVSPTPPWYMPPAPPMSTMDKFMIFRLDGDNGKMAYVKCDTTYDSAVEHARTLFPSLEGIPNHRIACALYRDDPAGPIRVTPRSWADAVLSLPNYNIVDFYTIEEGRSVYDGKEGIVTYPDEKGYNFAPFKVEKTLTLNYKTEQIYVRLSDDYEEAVDIMLGLIPEFRNNARARVNISYDIINYGEVCHARIAPGDWPLAFQSIRTFDNVHVSVLADDLVPLAIRMKEMEANKLSPPPYKVEKRGFFSRVFRFFTCRK